MAELHLTLSDIERSKSRSLRFFMVRNLYGIHIFPAVYYHLNLDATKSVFARRGYPLSQQSFLFNNKCKILDYIYNSCVCVGGGGGREAGRVFLSVSRANSRARAFAHL